MRPHPRSTMPGSTARLANMGPSRLTAAVARQSSLDCWRKGPETRFAALLTRTSTPPKARSAVCTMAFTWSSSPTSQRAVTTSAPAERHASAVSSSGPLLRRVARTRRAPSAANASAVALPMFRPAPVMSTTLPVRPMSMPVLLAPRGEHTTQQDGQEAQDGGVGRPAPGQGCEVPASVGTTGEARKWRVVRQAHHERARGTPRDVSAPLNMTGPARLSPSPPAALWRSPLPPSGEGSAHLDGSLHWHVGAWAPTRDAPYTGTRLRGSCLRRNDGGGAEMARGSTGSPRTGRAPRATRLRST